MGRDSGRSKARRWIVVCPAAPLTMNASARPSGDKARAGMSRNASDWPLGSVTAKCVSGSSGREAGRFQTSPAAAPMLATASSQAAASRQRGARAGVGLGAPGSGPASSSRRRASAMSWSRRAGSFTRQRRRTLATAAGSPAGRAFHSGSSLITAARISETVSPPNGRRAVSIS